MCVRVQWGWDNPDVAWLGGLFFFMPLSVSPSVLGPVGQPRHVLLMVMAEPNRINFFQAFGNIKSVDISLAKASYMAKHKSGVKK